MISNRKRSALISILASLCLSSLGAPLALDTAEAAPPGVRGSAGMLPIEAFLVPHSQTAFTISRKPLSLLKGRREFVTAGVTLLDSETYTVLLYREAGGEVVGLPVYISLSEFAAYKSQGDRERLALSELTKKVSSRAGGTSEGLINIKIPVKVPPGLSAITGKGESNIRITGSRRIDFSGISQYTTGQAQTANTRSSKFPTINFEQESQLNVQGSIGDRITIELSQDSRSQRDLGESLRLRYDGDDDGMIQEIEAGNTSLTLPGTRLVGFSAQSRGGLFGIKTRGKVGGLNFTMVTSQDKGASNRKTFQGQAEEMANDIKDYQYLEDTYFFLDEAYRTGFQTGQLVGNDQVDITSVRVFVNDYNEFNDIELRAIPGEGYAFWNPDGAPNVGLSKTQNGGMEVGNFHELDRDQFTVYETGYLIMNTGRIYPASALAVVYRTRSGRSYGDLAFIPDPTNPDKKINLKLIKARQQRYNYPTWPLSWRNVYSLGGREIEPEGFELRIFRDVPGQEAVDNQQGVSYIQILGLDRHTNGASLSSPPDNLVDIDGGNNIPGLNLAVGHLVFAQLEPFGAPREDAEDLDDDARVPRIYTETNSSTRSEAGRFFLRVRSRSRATQFNLGFGIIENSEEVLLNNRRLAKGQDYTIDYQFGQIRFTGEAAELVSDPTANLVINYGSKNLLGFGQQKSLLGIRAEHPFKDEHSMVGMTLLYSSQRSASQRVRVGNEPVRTIIWDTNARFRFSPEILTDMVNKLPFVSTQTASSVNIDAEIAQSMPNPNTKGVAYIDDFEGAQNRLSFSTSSKLPWSQASKPKLLPGVNHDPLRRGLLTWYTPVERDRTSLSKIQPARTGVTAEQSAVEILVLRFDPFYSDNRYPQRVRQPGKDSEPSWAGIMSFLSGIDLSRSKYLELWIRGKAGRLHVDLGEISERASLLMDDQILGAQVNPSDFYPDTTLVRALERLIVGGPNGTRTEDRPLGLGLPGDNVATPDEDIGLDVLTDEQESKVFEKLFPGSAVPADPFGDNFADVDLTSTGIRQRYPTGVNGSQGNNAERTSIPDTEDLSKNGILDTRNHYLRYSVEMGENGIIGYNPEKDVYDPGLSVVVPGSESNLPDTQGTAAGADHPPWRLIRIPLRGNDAPRTTVGDPDTTFASAIDFVRLWIEHDDTTTVQIYSFEAIGSDWQEDPSPYEFQVASIGTDNKVYKPPDNLKLETDPVTGEDQLERSLLFEFTDLPPGEQVSATRRFVQEDNYTNYGTLTMFVHGGNSAFPTDTFPAPEDALGGKQTPVELFLRFASIPGDTLNYYEYRSGVHGEWAPDLNTAEIDLELMSQLKGQLLDLGAVRDVPDPLTLALKIGEEVPATYDRDRNLLEITIKRKIYAVRGNPALSKIRSFTVGVRNRTDLETLTGGIWLNELRVDNIRRKRAFSGHLSLQAILADLGNLSINVDHRSGDFQNLSGGSSGSTTNRFSLDSQLNVDKFLPGGWSTSVPVRFSYNRTAAVPRLRQGSDIVLTSAQKAGESDARNQLRFNISLRKRPARQDPRLLSQILFDNINASFNYSSDNADNGAISRRTSSSGQNINGNFGYDLSWPQRSSLRPFKWVPILKSLREAEFFYLPSSIRYSTRFSRSVRSLKSFSAAGGDTSEVISNRNETFSMNEVYSLKFLPFRSITANYDMSVDRDLRGGFAFTRLQFGRERTRNQKVTFSFSPRVSRWFNVSTQYNANYRETNEAGGQRTPYGNIRRGLTVTSSNNTSARFTFNLPALFQPLARRGKGEGGFSIVRLIGRAGSTLQNIQASASRTRASNLFGLLGRPPLKYQLGLADTAAVATLNVSGLTRTPTRRVDDRANASSGVRLPGGFQMGTNASYNHSRSFGNANVVAENTALPNVDVQWRGLEKFPVLRWIWASSSLQFGYKEGRTRRGDGGLNDLLLTEDSSNSDYAPLLSWTAKWKNQMTTTLRSTQNRQEARRYQRNVADTTETQHDLDARLIGTTLTETSGFQASLRYTLSSKILKTLQSNVDLTIDYSMSSSIQHERPGGTGDEAAEPVIRRHNDSWSTSLSAQYQFSRKFTGGARFRHESRKDLLRDLTNKVWEFRLWGEIRFN